MSYSSADREEAVGLIGTLKGRLGEVSTGFTLVDKGEPQLGDVTMRLWDARLVLAVVSESALANRNVLAEWESYSRRSKRERKRLVPVYLLKPESVRIPFFLKDHQGVVLTAPGGLDRLVDGLKQQIGPELYSSGVALQTEKALSVAPHPSSLLLRHITLANIRCFESFEMDLLNGATPVSLTVVLGDNASGKSTLLRSLALGLASESDASALIKQLPGPFVRRGAEEGTIRLELCDPDNGRELTITTRILNGGTPDEKVRKETDPDLFPWEDVFVCAYVDLRRPPRQWR